MKLLVLGGTQFVGRHIVERALDEGHEVTVFNRGRTAPGLFPQVEQLHGDRDGNLTPLRGRNWDAVVDVNGYLPRLVGDSAQVLRDAVALYAYVSTVSVYDVDRASAPLDENGPIATIADETVEDVDGDTYGALKYLCERAVLRELPDSTFIVRPGIVAGPHDPTDRTEWWLKRIAKADGDPHVRIEAQREQPLQLVDARDLGAFVVHAVAAGTTGTYNAVGPGEPLTFGGFFEACRAVTGSDTEPAWHAPDADAASAQPLTLPADGSAWALFQVDASRAREAGLRNRPLAQTLADTWSWSCETGGAVAAPGSR